MRRTPTTASPSAASLPSSIGVAVDVAQLDEVEDVRVVDRVARDLRVVGGKRSVDSPVIAVNDVFGASPKARRSSLYDGMP